LQQVRRVGSRLGWGVADQGVASLTNFLLNIFIARTLGAQQFGAFTLAYVTYGVANNMSRGLAIEPLLVRYSGTKMKTWRRATSACGGTALLVGLVTGICALAAGIVAGGTTGMAFLGLGLMLPGLMLQDSWRYAFFAVRLGRHAFINDMVWAVVQVPLLLILKATGHANVFWLVIAWGAGAYAGAAVGVLQARTLPSLTRALSWLTMHRDLGPRFLAENVGGNAASTLQSYMVSSLLGLESVGYMQSANVLMGPFKILSFGFSMITIPEAATLMRRDPRKAIKYCAAVSIGQTGLAALWTVALLIGLPLGLGHLMLGGMWKNAYPLVLPTALAVIANSAASGAGTGLHAMGAAKRSLRVALITSGISLALAFSGAVLGSMLLTLYFVAAAAFLGTLLSWLQLRRAHHESLDIPVSGPLSGLFRGRHHKEPAANRRPRFAAAEAPRGAPVTGAVSRPATAGSYVHETRQRMPHAASPGEEV
jgi:O-antigen/teichoic acid export membrane protein